MRTPKYEIDMYRIVDALEQVKPQGRTIRQLSVELDESYDTIQQAVSRLREDDRIEFTKSGRYLQLFAKR